MALFTTLVVDVTTRSVRGDSSVFRWMERCGEYSYGIYMYHNLVAFALTFGLHSLWQRLPLAWGILLYHGVLGFATLAIAIISKKTFEHVFLVRQRRPALS
jgi:peptidoglycan/LPS O-acetylase OafA/YrhL